MGSALFFFRPIWVYCDERYFKSKYLKDEAFCKTLKELDNRKPIVF
jgi:hypothetical protein